MLLVLRWWVCRWGFCAFWERAPSGWICEKLRRRRRRRRRRWRRWRRTSSWQFPFCLLQLQDGIVVIFEKSSESSSFKTKKNSGFFSLSKENFVEIWRNFDALRRRIRDLKKQKQTNFEGNENKQNLQRWNKTESPKVGPKSLRTKAIKPPKKALGS